MLRQKRSKMSRYRGSSSHGGGHKKKRRGAGHRGGVGLSGSGARGDQKKPSILRFFGRNYFGKRGFHSIRKKNLRVLNLDYIESSFDRLLDNGIIVKDGDFFVVDSVAMKYDKVLGGGFLTKKLKLICKDISESAKRKIELLGGVVEVVSKKKSSSSESSVDSNE